MDFTQCDTHPKWFHTLEIPRLRYPPHPLRYPPRPLRYPPHLSNGFHTIIRKLHLLCVPQECEVIWDTHPTPRDTHPSNGFHTMRYTPWMISHAWDTHPNPWDTHPSLEIPTTPLEIPTQQPHRHLAQWSKGALIRRRPLCACDSSIYGAHFFCNKRLKPYVNILLQLMKEHRQPLLR